MVLLGLLLVAAAVVAGTEVVLGNRETVTGEAFNQTATLTASEVFLAGVGTALVLFLGLLMVFGGMARTRARRRRARHVETERRGEIGQTERELSEVAEENERLRRELENERRMRDTLGGVAVPPTADGNAYDTNSYEPYPGMGQQSGPPVQSETDVRTPQGGTR